jgi:hypothetical protein
LGTFSTTNPEQSQKVLSVPDFSEHNELGYELPQEEMQNIRQNIQEQRVPKEAINRLEVLVGIGRLVTELTIDNVSFKLRSLKSKEQQDVYRVALAAPIGLEQAYVLKVQTLARSLYEVNDQPVEFLGLQKLEQKIEFIEELEDLVVGELYNKYNEMLKTHNDALKQDLGTTPNEVIETIKKS